MRLTGGTTYEGSYLLETVDYFGFGFGLDWKLAEIVSLKPSLNLELRKFEPRELRGNRMVAPTLIPLSLEFSLFERINILD